ncbi:hypothetical protein [Nodosilinea sp. E11]|uniref:hypothetical protein n=1 Tax=Nodosilinea sp. E11 TaxID=3037479 RepID=UPI0029350FA0|nr:hypothetical protein [Nodosilinea sp. E11]WOD37429.1 hypothetical protein RRF56_14560 [Nodosilinea sp. E11]
MQQVVLLVVGGMHPPSYTGQILSTIARDEVLGQLRRVVCAPQRSGDVLSAYALRQALDKAEKASLPEPELGLLIWAFSAGCVGAAALAAHWQQGRGPVLALFMVDGWGVPRPPGVPVHRLSHDRFTHDSSRWLGAGDEDFYADPAVPHLHLWQQPQTTNGWATAGRDRESLTAADFLCRRSRDHLCRYGLNINGP